MRVRLHRPAIAYCGYQFDDILFINFFAGFWSFLFWRKRGSGEKEKRSVQETGVWNCRGEDRKKLFWHIISAGLGQLTTLQTLQCSVRTTLFKMRHTTTCNYFSIAFIWKVTHKRFVQKQNIKATLYSTINRIELSNMSIRTNVKIRTLMYSIISATWKSFSVAFIWMVAHRGLVYLLKNTLHGLLTSTTRNNRSIAFIWVITLGLLPQTCVRHNKEHNKQKKPVFFGGTSVSFGLARIFWLDYASSMARTNEPDMPPKHTKVVPLVIYRTHIRPSEHDIVVIRGKWLHITGYQDTNTVDTASGSTSPRI